MIIQALAFYLFAFVAVADDRPDVALGPFHGLAALRLDKDAEQRGGVEQRLSGGHRDNCQVAKIHAQRFAVAPEDADHAVAPVADAKPPADGGRVPKQLVAQFLTDDHDAGGTFWIPRR